MENSFTQDFIFLTDKLKEIRAISFSAIARLIDISENRMKNIRREQTQANYLDIDKLIKKFPELRRIDFSNRHKFDLPDINLDKPMSEEEMQAEIDRLNEENNKLIDEITAKIEEIDFEKESNRTLVRMINRLMDALEKNEKEGGLSEEEEAEIEREVEEFKRNKKK